MRKLVIASALAASAFTTATPAFARDGSAYVGIEGGAMVVDRMGFKYRDALQTIDDAYVVDHDWGWDVDLIAGYDLGMVRVEGELGYKRASTDELYIDPAANFDLGAAPQDSFVNADGDSSVWSAMVNALIDIGDDDYSWSGFLGGGVGYANVDTDFSAPGINRFLDASDSGFAYQLIAGVRTAITPNLDLGLKYRFFTVNNLTFDVDAGSTPAALAFDAETKWRSHSLLASLVYNFGAPAAAPVYVAPPPPPPAPATQTCPDGTVILATEVCPAPPPPPPPPPPAPERG
ncbi:porin family protein [Sphingomonas sabuli]|uniref:Porin family protein n=1 Tax=Sphingomonas sabuli TaxID=2764186 RepID=A0A7G9L2G4_9SPHN|nr:outer membrane beta-barrel protein [Sphingomonas sabuli]QNM82813.1 porin family protein [Sphingomonas sabuli]